MQIINQAETTAALRRIYFLAVDPTDLKTRKTGLSSFTVKLSKNGATGAAGSGTVHEVDSTNLPGVYYYELAVGEPSDLGLLVVDITQASMETREIVVEIGANSLYSVATTALLATTVEGTHSFGDVLRLAIRLLIAKKSSYLTGTVVVRDLADTKDSFTITATTTGITALSITDAT